MSDNNEGRKVVVGRGLNYVVYDVEKPRDGETDEYKKKKGPIDEYADVLCYAPPEKGEITLGTLKEIKEERKKHGETYTDELFVNDWGHDIFYKLQKNLSRYPIGKISDFGHGGENGLYVCGRREDQYVNRYKKEERELLKKLYGDEEDTKNKMMDDKSEGGKRKSRRHRKSKKLRKGKSRKNRRKSNRRCR